MRTLLRKHLTYANVMSSLAIFMLLGGTAVAAGKLSGSRLKDKSVSGKKLKSGSVSNSKLRSNAVTNSKIQAGSISGSRIAPNTLTDREINMAKLGKISKSSTADNSGKVDNKDAAQLVVKCPSGTVDLGASCAENGTRSSATGYAAAKTCVQAGGYLPDAAALIGAEDAGKISIGGSEWSSSWSYAAAPEGAIVTSSGISTTANPSSAAYGFRCFFTLRER